MESGCYPDSWNQILVCLISKSGIKDDPNIYRSTALSNCLEKHFNTIFFNKLLSKPQKKKKKKKKNLQPKRNFRKTVELQMIFSE